MDNFTGEHVSYVDILGPRYKEGYKNGVYEGIRASVTVVGTVAGNEVKKAFTRQIARSGIAHLHLPGGARWFHDTRPRRNPFLLQKTSAYGVPMLDSIKGIHACYKSMGIFIYNKAAGIVQEVYRRRRDRRRALALANTQDARLIPDGMTRWRHDRLRRKKESAATASTAATASAESGSVSAPTTPAPTPEPTPAPAPVSRAPTTPSFPYPAEPAESPDDITNFPPVPKKTVTFHPTNHRLSPKNRLSPHRPRLHPAFGFPGKPRRRQPVDFSFSAYSKKRTATAASAATASTTAAASAESGDMTGDMTPG